MNDLILAVSSSTAAVGVAVVAADDHHMRPLAAAQQATDRRHAEELTPMLRDVLARASEEYGSPLSTASITRYAVDVGPGRFTGLRVGVATVRTLALAHGGTGVVGVSSLEALAAGQPQADAVVAIIDARRGEVFQQRFIRGELGWQADGDPYVGAPELAVATIAVGDVIVGDGADRYRDLYGRAEWDYRHGQEPDPVVIARLAAHRPLQTGPEVEPLYLRSPDVQINIRTRHSTP